MCRGDACVALYGRPTIMQPQSPRNILIFANPIAGRGRGRGIASQIYDLLVRHGYNVGLFFDPADQLELAHFSPDKSVLAAIVIGGDGTLRAVAARAVQAYAPDEPPPLLIIPLGTANLMGRHLGIRWDEENFEARFLETIRQCPIVRLDTAGLNGELFLLMAGIGLDAQIVHELDRLRGGPIGFLSYAMPALLAMGTYQYPPLTITVDGRLVIESTPAVAFVGNIPEYGTGFPLLPHARPDDSLLDVCVLPCRSRAQVLHLFLQAAAGEHLQAEGVIYLKARTITVDSPAKVPVQMDGEPAGHTPVSINLLPMRLRFIVPADRIRSNL